MTRRRVSRITTLSFIAVLLTAPAIGQDRAAIVTRSQAKQNTYLAGGDIHPFQDVAGDLIAAGGRVDVDHAVQNNLLAVGGSVAISGPIGEDARVAGGKVQLSAPITGEFVAAAGEITLTPAARVGGDASLAAGSVELAGKISGGLRIAADTARISGEIDGDVRVAGRDIEFLPAAVVRGRLIYTGPQAPRIDAGARIENGTIETSTASRRAAAERRSPQGYHVFPRLGLLVLGILVVLLFPRYTSSAAQLVRERPWPSLALGIILLIAVPFVAVLAMVTILGIPLGFTLLLLYGISLLLGLLTGALSLGGLVLSASGRPMPAGRGTRIFSLVIAAIALTLIGWVPVIGPLTIFVVMLFGLGGWYLTASRYLEGWRPVA